MKSLPSLAVQVTKKYNERQRGGWQYTLRIMNIIQMSMPELLTSSMGSLNIHRQDQSRNKKMKLVELLCADNSIFHQKYNIE